MEAVLAVGWAAAIPPITSTAKMGRQTQAVVAAARTLILPWLAMEGPAL